MRSILSQYILDNRRRPRLLDDLVKAGYLKRVPKDPMIGQSDTWIADWSNDRSCPAS
jgi:general secretion pathway protein G